MLFKQCLATSWTATHRYHFVQQQCQIPKLPIPSPGRASNIPNGPCFSSCIMVDRTDHEKDSSSARTAQYTQEGAHVMISINSQLLLNVLHISPIQHPRPAQKWDLRNPSIYCHHSPQWLSNARWEPSCTSHPAPSRQPASAANNNPCCGEHPRHPWLSHCLLVVICM